jgi:NitT/TauT family transport system substrate-binding protein
MAPILTADVNGKQDIVLIASGLNHPILALYSTDAIKTADDLKGKIIASDKPGTPVDYSAKTALSLLKLKPSDVQLRPIGSAAEILAAMLSGQVQAGMVAPPQSFQVEQKGFHVLQDIFSQPYQNVGLMAKKSRLDELKDSIIPLLAAYRDGIATWYSDPTMAKKVFAQYTQVTDTDVLNKSYDFYSKTAPFQKDLQPTMDGIKAMADFLSTDTPGLKDANPATFVDTRFLSQLPK